MNNPDLAQGVIQAVKEKRKGAEIVEPAPAKPKWSTQQGGGQQLAMLIEKKIKNISHLRLTLNGSIDFKGKDLLLEIAKPVFKIP